MVFRFLLLLLCIFSAHAAEVAGVKLPDEDQKLVLNGAGLSGRGLLLRIWLGENPVQADLKGALLGGKQ